MKRIIAVAACLLSSVPLFAQRKLVEYVQTKYPRTAMYAGVSGKVGLSVTVLADGSVRSVDALYGPKLLSVFCERDVKRWRFQSGKEEVFRVVFAFRLINAGKEQYLFDDKTLETTIIRIRPRLQI
jgi:hypothetical protein